MTIEAIEQPEANHEAAVRLLQAACKVYLAGYSQMREDVQEGLDAALSAKEGALSVTVTILPNPFIEVLYEPLTGDTRMLFSLALPLASVGMMN